MNEENAQKKYSDDEPLSPKEFCDALGGKVSRSRIYQLCENDQIPHYRIGQKIFLKLEDFKVERKGENDYGG